MFEQQLYEPQTVATPTQDGDLFHSYEIKTWTMSPRVYKILAASAVANIFAILVIAQTSVLTMKGCDSPLVGRVCQVLDTVYVGTMLFGTDRDYVDAAYERTELEDAEITYLDLTGVSPQLSYPEGYFQIANPETMMPLEGSVDDLAFTPPGEIAPGIPYSQPSTGGSLMDTTPNYPQPQNNVVTGDLPSGFGNGTVANPTLRKPRRPRPGRTINVPPANVNANTDPGDEIAGIPDTNTNTAPTASPTPISSEPVVVINKKPLTDFADVVATRWEAKEVDLNQPFMIVLNGVITLDGKLDRAKSRFDVSKQQGEPKMIDVAKQALEALGDSGFLTYLQAQGIDKVTATVVQDDKQISVIISSTQKTVERANSVSAAISAAIVLGKLTQENPSDERTLLNSAKTSADGKNFVLNFAIPKPIAQEMITRKLKEAQAKKAEQPKPNGNAITKGIDNTAKK